ncbi:hypothetical protein Q1695_004594 [Nippostrongylus brasiliensis]|nr:hypothetical protein Q1695_004594 [Nippostrongylus brasiliensis]
MLAHLVVTLSIWATAASHNNSVTFVLLGQRSHFDELKLAELKNSILQQAESLGESVEVIIPHADLASAVGFWAPWTLFSSLYASSAPSKWYVFLELDSAVNADLLLNFLKSHDHTSKLFLGHGLQDESPTIIHHFHGFDTDDDQPFLFPDFAAGVVLSKGLIECLTTALDKSSGKTAVSSFSIDAKHELALLVQKLCRTRLLSHPDIFCLEEGEQCGIHFKTYSGFHNIRLPVIKRTWGALLPNIAYFSDLANYVIPTIDSGVKNTDKGHCAKTLVILKHFVDLLDAGKEKYLWLLIADDDTLVSPPRLLRLLSCYDNSEKVIIGERYGYGFSTSGNTGYDYPTGGAGMVFSPSAARAIATNCECPADDSPDDMIIGLCARRLDVSIIHNAAFHQARPIDYPTAYLRRLPAISFHKFDEVDPYKVYMEYLFEPTGTRQKTEL